MTLAFTICSLNYMHQAITLGNSFLDHNPNSKFIIGLVDIIDKRLDTEKLSNLDIIPLSSVIDSDKLENMVSRYNIIELNTAVKPFYFNYFFKEKIYDKIIYLDPDICVYNSFKYIENKLDDNISCIVTPHCNTPNKNEVFNDHLYLKVGIFNLGFLALKNNEESHKFIDWLMQRLYDNCYISPYRNLFVDQLWSNLAICYFENIFVLKDVGYNMAIWNMHERTLIFKNNKYYINNVPLVFFHFSGIIVDDFLLTKHDNNLNYDNKPEMKQFISDYHNTLIINNKNYFKNMKCRYIKSNFFKSFFKSATNKLITLILRIQTIVE
jgi:hypothetical protein